MGSCRSLLLFFSLLQIVIVAVLYFVQKLALAVVDCYAETEFLEHGVASLNAFGNFFLQLLHFKNTKNLLFHQGLFAPAFQLLIASGALILDQIGKSAFWSLDWINVSVVWHFQNWQNSAPCMTLHCVTNAWRELVNSSPNEIGWHSSDLLLALFSYCILLS